MSNLGHRGFPGSPGLEISDYELISKALNSYSETLDSNSKELNEVYTVNYLVDTIILWYKLRDKINAIGQN